MRVLMERIEFLISFSDVRSLFPSSVINNLEVDPRVRFK